MTGPMRNSRHERHLDSFVESPTRANKTAQEVVVSSMPPVSINTSGLATEAKQDSGNTILSNILTAISGILNIRSLTFSSDKVDVSGSSVAVTKTPLTASAPVSFSVGNTSSLAIAANANRKGLVIINTTNRTVSLGINAPAVLNAGITLLPSGTWTMDEFTFTTGAINAIASVAATNISIQEFTT